MTWSERFKTMKKVLKELDILNNGGKFGNKEISEITGNTYQSIVNGTAPKGTFPRNLKLAVVIFEGMYKIILRLKRDKK